MTPITAISLCGGAAVLQALAGDACRLGSSPAPLAVIAAAHVAIHASPGASLVALILCGTLLDTLSLDPWGANTAALLVLHLSVELGAARGWAGPPLPRTCLLGAAFLVHAWARVGIVWLGDGIVPRPGEVALAVVHALVLSWPAFASIEGLRSHATAPLSRAG